MVSTLEGMLRLFLPQIKLKVLIRPCFGLDELTGKSNFPCQGIVDMVQVLSNNWQIHCTMSYPAVEVLRVSFSRSTPEKVSDIILREVGDHPKVYVWYSKGPNPHMGHLAWADAFIITPDSVSMLSKACSTGKPVYVVGVEHCKWKFSAHHKTFRERKLVKQFTRFEDAFQEMGNARLGWNNCRSGTKHMFS